MCIGVGAKHRCLAFLHRPSGKERVARSLAPSLPCKRCGGIAAPCFPIHVCSLPGQRSTGPTDRPTEPVFRRACVCDSGLLSPRCCPRQPEAILQHKRIESYVSNGVKSEENLSFSLATASIATLVPRDQPGRISKRSPGVVM